MLVTCFGPTSSGKSCLLQKLVSLDGNEEDGDEPIGNVPKTLPTAGVDQYKIPLKRLQLKDVKYEALKTFCFGPEEESEREKYVLARELGGAIQPMWSSHIKTSQASQVNNCNC
jgi:hypothetical protein